MVVVDGEAIFGQVMIFVSALWSFTMDTNARCVIGISMALKSLAGCFSYHQVATTTLASTEACPPEVKQFAFAIKDSIIRLSFSFPHIGTPIVVRTTSEFPQ